MTDDNKTKLLSQQGHHDTFFISYLLSNGVIMHHDCARYYPKIQSEAPS